MVSPIINYPIHQQWLGGRFCILPVRRRCIYIYIYIQFHKLPLGMVHGIGFTTWMLRTMSHQVNNQPKRSPYSLGRFKWSLHQEIPMKKTQPTSPVNPMWPYPTGGPALTLGTLEWGFGCPTWAWQRHCKVPYTGYFCALKASHCNTLLKITTFSQFRDIFTKVTQEYAGNIWRRCLKNPEQNVGDVTLLATGELQMLFVKVVLPKNQPTSLES